MFFIAVPLYWVMKTSFSPENEVWEKGLPSNPTIQNYIDILSPNPPRGTMAEVVGTYAVVSPSALIPLKNSLITAIITVILTILISSPMAYNLSRLSYRGKRLISFFILFAYIFPTFMLMAPIMFLVNVLGISNNIYTLAFLHLAYSVPFSTYMLRGYFMSIPKDLEEAAFIDGCSRFQALLKIVLPLALPGLVTVAVFSFVMSWGDMVFALVTLKTQDNYTLPLYMSYFLWGGEITDPGRLAALTMIAGIIPVVLFLLIQKYVRMGIVAGAVKY
jgi:multiple sugar transport system permease protein